MKEQTSMGIDPKIKKEINEEDWEKTDDRDEAAVIIGPDWKKAKTPKEAEQFRKEVERLKEKLEKEGRADNLRAYVKMHKEIKLPKKEISSDFSETLIKNKGLLWCATESEIGGEKYKYFFPHSIVLDYIDSDGNIASFNLDPLKLTPTRKIIEQAGEHPDNSMKREFYTTISELIDKEKFNNTFFKLKSDRSKEEQNNIEILISKINRQILDYQERLEIRDKKKKEEEFDL